jgi:hypothetical protein
MKVTTLFLLISLMSASGHPCNNKDGLKRLVASSEIIALAEIIAIEDIRDGLWSGTFETKQYVTYQVQSILKGELDNSTIKVAHFLYRNSLTVDHEKPQLSPKLFQKGKILLLFIKIGQRIMKGEKGNYFRENELVSVDENCGAVVSDSKLLERVKKTISSK